jgi:type II secretory pathway predicted ATPase ExeA
VALYLEHFGLSEPPFRITPHTDFFFDGADRGATLEALIYAILHDEGIVKVSGEVGSGKTMLCRVLMERLPAHVETIYLATPSLARDEILHAIADELDLKLPDGRITVVLRELQEQLIRLYAAGRRVVVLIDEAHVMPDETLEQVRLLSNLESNRHKMLQIVLFGQPELDATIAKPNLRQLRDRVTNSFRMRPLSETEVAKYVAFRMRAAGYRGPEVFSPRAIRLIARASSGLTRRINILADKALLASFTGNSHAITERQVRAAIADSEFAATSRPRRPALYFGAALAAAVLAGAGIQWALSSRSAPAPAAASAPAPKAEPAPVSAPPPKTEPAPAAPQIEAKKEPEPIAPPPQLGPEQQRRFAGYSPARQPLLSARLSATREALQRAPDERFTIELFNTDNPDPARLERFLLRAQDLIRLENVFVIPMASGLAAAPNSGMQYRLRVVYGEFATRDDALEAARRLPPKYQQAFTPLPRTFRELRSQI